MPDLGDGRAPPRHAGHDLRSSRVAKRGRIREPAAPLHAMPESPASDLLPGADDLALVRRARSGDEIAFRALGERLRAVPRMLASANRRLVHPLAAQELTDLAQDTIVIIWEKLETFEGRSTLEGWAARFCRLEIMNRARAVARRHRRQGISLEAVHEPALEPHSPAMPIESHELDEALSQLPEPARAVIVLKHLDGLMFKDIALRLGIPENTAKTRYYRGLTQLRRLLKADDGEAQDR